MFLSSINVLKQRIIYWLKRKSYCKGCCLNCQYYTDCAEDCEETENV